jgi:hypothetical protein
MGEPTLLIRMSAIRSPKNVRFLAAAAPLRACIAQQAKVAGKMGRDNDRGAATTSKVLCSPIDRDFGATTGMPGQQDPLALAGTRIDLSGVDNSKIRRGVAVPIWRRVYLGWVDREAYTTDAPCIHQRKKNR